MEDKRIIDNSMPHPEQEEPVESDYTIESWMPVKIQATVTATDETDAIENAKYQIKKWTCTLQSGRKRFFRNGCHFC